MPSVQLHRMKEVSSSKVGSVTCFADPCLQAVREGRAVDVRDFRHVDQEGQGCEAVRPHPLLGQVL